MVALALNSGSVRRVFVLEVSDDQLDACQTVPQNVGNRQTAAPFLALDFFLFKNRFDPENGILRIPQLPNW